MRGFILHQSNPPCCDVDRDKLMPCYLTNQDDYMRLITGNLKVSSFHGHFNMKQCKDEYVSMTCLRLSLAPVRYVCACASEKGDLNTGIG